MYRVALLLLAFTAAAHAQAGGEGASLFARQCGACHVAQAGPAVRRVGPNLWGIVGRPAGTVPDFRYSRRLAAADFTWDEARLDAYLANPQAVVPGGTMAYRQANPEIRARIMEWLKQQR